jgi:hypothetical protein
MSQSQPPATVRQPTTNRRIRRGAAAVIAQYIQELSAGQSARRPPQDPAPVAVPARLAPVPC